MTKIVKTVSVEEERVSDIICDICQKSCATSTPVDGDASFDCLEINGSFGYSSKHDGEIWDAHICQDCTDNFLEKIICFRKSSYIHFSSSHKKEINKSAERKRLIRKLTGGMEFEIKNR